MALSQMSNFVKQGFQHFIKGNTKNKRRILLGFMIMPVRNISCLEVSKNMSLLSNEKKITTITDMKLNEHTSNENPLVVILAWLMANKKHIRKYADIWMGNGFDVLTVNIKPWELLWPVTGTQIVASDLLKFLDQNKSYSDILLHGFSVGGYLWGEVMVQMAHSQDKYQHILDRISGQIWDSAADVTEIPEGVPKAVFPRNKIFANTLRKYMHYHMKTFDKVATSHYIRSSQMFHTTLVHSPALFLLGKADPIGSERANQRVRESWESMGIEVHWKMFDKSLHVAHYRKYPQEYTAQLIQFLNVVQSNKDKPKQAHTEIDTKKVVKVKQ